MLNWNIFKESATVLVGVELHQIFREVVILRTKILQGEELSRSNVYAIQGKVSIL